MWEVRGGGERERRVAVGRKRRSVEQRATTLRAFREQNQSTCIHARTRTRMINEDAPRW